MGSEMCIRDRNDSILINFKKSLAFFALSLNQLISSFQYFNQIFLLSSISNREGSKSLSNRFILSIIQTLISKSVYIQNNQLIKVHICFLGNCHIYIILLLISFSSNLAFFTSKNNFHISIITSGVSFDIISLRRVSKYDN